MRALALFSALLALTVHSVTPVASAGPAELVHAATVAPSSATHLNAAHQASSAPQSPAAPDVGPFMCPMHPDVITAAPGKCPRCNMTLVPGSPLAVPDFDVHVTTTPRVLKAGVPTKFDFVIHHPVSGEPARDYAVMHDKLFHLFVISRDLNEFSHIHPEKRDDGSFTITHTLPKPGHYKLFADFLPLGGGAQITGIPFATTGVDSDLTSAQASLVPDGALVKTADGVKVEITNERSTILGGEEVDLIFRFSDSMTQAPISDLERYLGAWGHLVILSEDMTEYVHAHPREETQPEPGTPVSGGPEVLFDALLPKAGNYRAWLQFQRNGVLSTVSFTFAAPEPGGRER